MDGTGIVFSQSMVRKHKQILDNPGNSDDIGVAVSGTGTVVGEDTGLGRPNLTFDWGRRAGDERKDRRQEVLNALQAGAPRATSLLHEAIGGGTSPVSMAITGSPPQSSQPRGSEVKSPKAAEQKFPERGIHTSPSHL
jgi:hypothetical protein